MLQIWIFFDCKTVILYVLFQYLKQIYTALNTASLVPSYLLYAY